MRGHREVHTCSSYLWAWTAERPASAWGAREAARRGPRPPGGPLSPEQAHRAGTPPRPYASRSGCCRQRHISRPGGRNASRHTQEPRVAHQPQPKVTLNSHTVQALSSPRSIVVPLATTELFSQQDGLRLQMGFSLSAHRYGCGPTLGLKRADSKRPEARRPARSG